MTVSLFLFVFLPFFFHICFFEYDSLHRRTGDERSTLLPTIFVVVVYLVFFSFPYWMMFFKYTHTDPHTHTYKH